jgi:hypothetical protein
MALPSPAKAGEMLRHGTVHGEPLTPSQKGLFGLIRGGGRPTRMKKKKKRDRRLEPRR